MYLVFPRSEMTGAPVQERRAIIDDAPALIEKPVKFSTPLNYSMGDKVYWLPNIHLVRGFVVCIIDHYPLGNQGT